MLTVFPAEMYQNEEMLYRVVHGQEEALEYTRKGWTEEIPNGKKREDYKVYHHEALGSAAVRRGPGRPPLKKED